MEYSFASDFDVVATNLNQEILYKSFLLDIFYRAQQRINQSWDLRAETKHFQTVKLIFDKNCNLLSVIETCYNESKSGRLFLESCSNPENETDLNWIWIKTLMKMDPKLFRNLSPLIKGIKICSHQFCNKCSLTTWMLAVSNKSRTFSGEPCKNSFKCEHVEFSNF